MNRKTSVNQMQRSKNKIFIRFTAVLLVVLITTGSVLFGKADSVLAASQTEAFVQRLYKTSFGREADAEGLNYWVTSLENGSRTGTEVSENFLLSEEMRQKNLTDSQFLDVLYISMMDRPSDSEGKNYWLVFLQNGCGRTGILRQFLLSPEFTQICANYGIQRGTPNVKENRDENLYLTCFVSQQYFVIFGRTGDASGLNYWTGMILHEGASIEAVVGALIFSEEYKPWRDNPIIFVKTLYRAFMGREPDGDEVDFWLYYLIFGQMTRRELFQEFAYSEEFQEIVYNMGLQPSSPPPAPWLGTDYEIAIANEFMEVADDYRNYAHGLEPFIKNAALMEGAHIRAREMQVSESHDRPSGRSFSTIFDQVGYDYYEAAEWIGRIDINNVNDSVTSRAMELIYLALDDDSSFLSSEDYINIGVGVYLEANILHIVVLLGTPDVDFSAIEIPHIEVPDIEILGPEGSDG